MAKLRTLSALVAVVLQACAVAHPPVIIHEPFDAAQAKAMLQPGANTLTGSALIRQRGGGIVTCAGNTVRLVPATLYAKRRMAVIYGGVRIARQTVPFSPDPAEYAELTRTTVCNAQGFFTFNGVADGDFFVVTEIRWTVGYSVEGGSLMERVSLQGAEKKEITLAQ